MKKLRVLVLLHETLVPPEDASGYSMQEVDEWRTEYDVTRRQALEAMGHEVRVLGMGDNLAELRSVITELEAGRHLRPARRGCRASSRTTSTWWRSSS